SCDRIFIFVLSEEGSGFSFKDRLEMVKAGTAHLSNVTVLTTGPYLISSATFPTYFLKERDLANRVFCEVDIEIFTKFFVPRLNITKRFVGTEPLSAMTEKYNEELKNKLPLHNIDLIEIPRKEKNGTAISASAVRDFISKGDIESVKKIVPNTTFEYLKNNNLI
ncbi:MAG: [citrate (pro-3S)-lyase] ligase, partial [Ruminococcaceae bacterium]|nr:[citrate (pro-3S)-lyase] ligase [Oscillospiraceae bacterium]